MGKKMARVMARIVALEEAMALMLRGSLSHGIKKKKAKAKAHTRVWPKKAVAKRAIAKKPASKKAVAKKPAPKKAVAKPTTCDIAAISAAVSAVKPATVKPAAINLPPGPAPQAAVRPAPMPAAR